MRQRGLHLLVCLGGLLAASAAVAQEITWLAGHDAPLYAVRYAPDGKTLVSADVAGGVTVWDHATGQPIRSLHEHRGAALTVSVSPGGRQFATAGIDRSIRVYDLPLRGSLAAFTSFSGDPTALAVSPDGKQVVTGDAGRLVRRWNLENNQPLRDYSGSIAPVVGVVLHPDGETVLAAADDGSLRAWDLDDGKSQGDWTGPPLASLAIHPQGSLLVTGGSDGLLRLLRWPVAANRQLGTFGGEVRAIAVTADGSRTIAGGADQTVRIFDNARGEQRHSLTNPAGPVTSIAVAHDDTPLAAAGSDQGAVTFWDVREGQAAGSLAGHQGAIRALRFAANNQRLLTAGADGTVRLWQLPQPPSEVEAHKQAIAALAVSRDRQFAVTAGADKTLALWTLPAAKKTHTAEKLPQVADCVAVSDDGRLVAAGDAAGTIHLFAAGKGKSLQAAGTIGAHAGGVRGLEFLPGEGGLISCGADGTWKRWQMPLLAGPALPQGEQPWRLLAITADGSRLAAEGNDRIVHVYDGTTGKLLRSSEPQPHAGTDLAFDAPGQRLLRATAAGTVQVFDPQTGQPTHELAGHQGAIHDLAVADTGPTLASAGEDGTVRIWNVPPAPLAAKAHEAAIVAAAASNDGRQAATSASDGSLALWDTAGLAAAEKDADKPAVPTARWLQAGAKDAPAMAALAFAADGAALYSGDAAGRLQAWNTAAAAKGKGDKELAEPTAVATTPGAPVTALAVAADEAVLVSGHADGTVRRWSLPLAPPEAIEGLQATHVEALSPDRKQLAFAGKATVIVFDLAQRRQVQALKGAPEKITALAWSPAANSPYLAAGGADGQLKLWNMTDGSEAAAWAAAKAAIEAVSFSPDGASLAAADATSKVSIWRVADVIAAAKAKAAGDQDATKDEQAEAPAPALSLADHQGAVHAVAWTSDGKQLLTAGADKTVRLWNAADGKPVKTLAQHAAAVQAMAVAPAQGLVTTASADKQIRITKLADGSQAALITSPSAADALEVSPDGSRLAAALADGSVAVWDLASGQLLQGLTGTSDQRGDSPNGVLAWLTDDTLLANLAGDQVAVAKLSATHVIQAHEGPATAVAIRADAAQVFTAGQDKRVKLWDAQGKEVRSFAEPAAPLRTLAFDGAGRLAAAGDEKAIFLWNADNGQAAGKFEVPAATRQLAFIGGGAPEGQAAAKAPPQLVASMADGRIRCFDPADGTVREIVAGPPAGGPLAVVAGGTTILAPTAEHGVQFTTLAMESVLAGHQGAATAVAFLPEGKQLVTGGADKSVRLWDRSQGKVVRTFAGSAEAITAVAVSPEPGFVVAASTNKRLRAWNLSDAKPAYTIELPAAARQLAVDKSGKRLVTTGGEATAQVWDAAQGKPMQQVAHGGTVASAALTADGRWLVTAGTDKQLLRTPVACQQVVPAHEGKVNSLAVAADGKHIVTAGEDRLVKLWNASGELVRQLSGAATAVSHVAISPDGQQIAAGGDPQRTSQEVLIWKAADGSLQKKLATGAAVVCLAFDDQGRRLIVGGADSKMRSYEAQPLILGEVATLPAVPTAVAPHAADGRYLVAGADGKLRGVTSHLERLLLGHEGEVQAVAISPDGALAYSAGADKTVRQWNLSTGQAARTYRGSQGAVLALALSPDGSQLFAGGSDKAVRSWNAASGKAAWQHTLPQAVRSLHLAGGGKRLVVGCDDPIVRVLDLAAEPGKSRLLETFTGHGGVLRAVAASADGSMIVSGGTDNTLRQWHSPVVTATAAHRGPIAQVAFTPDGKHMLTASADGKAILWDAQSLAHVRPLVEGKTPLVGVAIDPSSERVAVISGKGALHLLDHQTGEPLAAWQSPEKLRAVALGAEGQILLGGESGRIVNLALADEGELIEVQQFTDHTGPVLALAMAAGGEFYSTSADRTARRWFAATARPRHVLEGHQAQVVDLVYMSDTVLVSGSADGTARRWNLAAGGEAMECVGHDGPVLAVAGRREGKEVVTAGRDGTLRLWNESGQEVAQWPVPQTAGTVYAAAWSPNERYLVTAGSSGQWQLWDRQTKAKPAEPERAMPGHSAAVLDVAWNASGQRFATVDQGGKLFLWNASDGNLLYHVQLPAPAAYAVAYSPDGKELAVATTDQRLVILAIPSFAQ